MSDVLKPFYSLKEFKKQFQINTFGKESVSRRKNGYCINCNELALPKCYSEAGKREFKISGLCEPCFDEIMK